MSWYCQLDSYTEASKGRNSTKTKQTSIWRAEHIVENTPEAAALQIQSGAWENQACVYVQRSTFSWDNLGEYRKAVSFQPQSGLAKLSHGQFQRSREIVPWPVSKAELGTARMSWVTCPVLLQ